MFWLQSENIMIISFFNSWKCIQLIWRPIFFQDLIPSSNLCSSILFAFYISTPSIIKPDMRSEKYFLNIIFFCVKKSLEYIKFKFTKILTRRNKPLQDYSYSIPPLQKNIFSYKKNEKKRIFIKIRPTSVLGRREKEIEHNKIINTRNDIFLPSILRRLRLCACIIRGINYFCYYYICICNSAA